jgi:hypothetical protein
MFAHYGAAGQTTGDRPPSTLMAVPVMCLARDLERDAYSAGAADGRVVNPVRSRR